MFKKLHVRITSVQDRMVRMKVIEQSHRRKSFSFSDDTFSKGGPMQICSMSFPAYSDRILYVRGNEEQKDSSIVRIPLYAVNDVLETVLLYNQYFNKNTLEMNDVVEGLSKWEKRNA